LLIYFIDEKYANNQIKLMINILKCVRFEFEFVQNSILLWKNKSYEFYGNTFENDSWL